MMMWTGAQQARGPPEFRTLGADQLRGPFPFDAERISFSAEAARQHVQEKATDEIAVSSPPFTGMSRSLGRE